MTKLVHRFRAVAPTLLSLTLVAGCPDPEPAPEPDPEACVSLSEDPVVFDDVELAAGETESFAEWVITSECDGLVEVGAANVDGSGNTVFEVTSGSGQLVLENGESKTFELRFRPFTPGTFTTEIVVLHSAGSSAATLEGTALAPEIELTPEAVDVGAPYIGCETPAPLEIRNVGNQDLEVSSIEVFTASPGELSLDENTLTNGLLPWTIAPFDPVEQTPVVEFTVDYLPLDTFADNAFVTVRSTAFRRPEVVAEASGSGTVFGDNVDVFELPRQRQMDVLITLDRGIRPAEVAAAAVDGIDGLVAALGKAGIDYRVAGVVSDTGCVLGDESTIDASFGGAEAVAAFGVMADLAYELDGTTANAARGYSLAEAALSTTNTGPGGCNEGLVRDDALLSLVHISDRAEASVNSWSHFVSVYQGLKADPERVRINAIVGDYPSGCDWADAGTGYYEGTVATGGRFLSICDATDWDLTFADLAETVFPPIGAFPLSQQPVPERLEVRIDGIGRPSGWRYDVSNNAIVFDDGAEPGGGSTVEVAYPRLPDCEG